MAKQLSRAALVINKLKQISGLHYDKDLADHIAQITGEKVAKQKISYWRDSDNVDYALILLAFPDIDYNWLFKPEEFSISITSQGGNTTVSEPNSTYSSSASSSIIEIPYYVQSVNAGKGVNLNLPSPANMKIPVGLISGTQPSFAVLNSGSSMSSAGILDGSTVICMAATEHYTEYVGKLVVLSVDGVTYLKRLMQNSDGSFYLHSENGSATRTEFYADIPLNDEQTIQVHGIAVYIISLAV